MWSLAFIIMGSIFFGFLILFFIAIIVEKLRNDNTLAITAVLIFSLVAGYHACIFIMALGLSIMDYFDRRENSHDNGEDDEDWEDEDDYDEDDEDWEDEDDYDEDDEDDDEEEEEPMKKEESMKPLEIDRQPEPPTNIFSAYKDKRQSKHQTESIIERTKVIDAGIEYLQKFKQLQESKQEVARLPEEEEIKDLGVKRRLQEEENAVELAKLEFQLKKEALEYELDKIRKAREDLYKPADKRLPEDQDKAMIRKIADKVLEYEKLKNEIRQGGDPDRVEEIIDSIDRILQEQGVWRG